MTGFAFDARAALKRARETRADPNLSNLPNRPPPQDAGLGGLGGLGRDHVPDPEIAPRPDLPTHPPICAFCVVADWHVALTLADGRKAHVRCAPSTRYWASPAEAKP